MLYLKLKCGRLVGKRTANQGSDGRHILNLNNIYSQNKSFIPDRRCASVNNSGLLNRRAKFRFHIEFWFLSMKERFPLDMLDSYH